MTNTKKAGENANSRTLVGTMVGITAAIAAQRIAEVGALQNKKKQMERDAVIIAETFLDTKLPESVDIIKQYISKKTSLEIADDANAAQVISALFYNEIESAQKEQMRLVNEIIDESSKNFGHNFSAEIKAQKFIEAINGWDEAEYKHKHLQANVTAEKDYQDLRAEARQSLIAAGILDKDGRISKEYCSKFKTPLKERITEEIPVIENKKSQTRKTRVVDVEKKNVLEGVIEEEKIELDTENMESSLVDETQIPIIKEVVVKEASTRKTHVRETVASNTDGDDTKEKTTTNKKPTTRKTQPKHQRQPVDDVLKTTNDESVDNKADENKDDTKKVEAKNTAKTTTKKTSTTPRKRNTTKSSTAKTTTKKPKSEVKPEAETDPAENALTNIGEKYFDLFGIEDEEAKATFQQNLEMTERITGSFEAVHDDTKDTQELSAVETAAIVSDVISEHDPSDAAAIVAELSDKVDIKTIEETGMIEELLVEAVENICEEIDESIVTTILDNADTQALDEGAAELIVEAVVSDQEQGEINEAILDDIEIVAPDSIIETPEDAQELTENLDEGQVLSFTQSFIVPTDEDGEDGDNNK